MFTDKQSLILCAIVAFGFSIFGILGILDNYVIIGVLVLFFLLIVINIFMHKPIDKKDEKSLELDLKNKNPNIFNNDNI